jgi:hypothetical protein
MRLEVAISDEGHCTFPLQGPGHASWSVLLWLANDAGQLTDIVSSPSGTCSSAPKICSLKPRPAPRTKTFEIDQNFEPDAHNRRPTDRGRL